MDEGHSERPPIEDIAAYARGEIADAELRARIEADEEAMELVRQIQTDDEFLTQLAGAWSNAPDGSGRGVPPAADLVPGYRILGELHRGGQGTVYRAIQERTKRTVAVKLMHGGAAASSKSRARFEREVELIASMRHPNIVTVFDGGDLPDGGYFVAMEFIRGVPLVRADAFDRDMDDKSRSESIRMKLEQFASICDAVQYAHLRGIIHRDIKPGNILIDRDGQPKVLDFGVAKVLGLGDTPDATLTGEFVGTFAYAAPEQVSGGADEIDTRCDIYALGVVLYEMTTGCFPYEISGPMSQTLKNITETEPEPPSRVADGLDSEIDAIIASAMAKSPDRRYQSVGSLAADIRRYLAGEPVEARRDSSTYLLAKLAKRHRGPIAAGMLLLLGLMGVSIWMSLLYVRATEAEQRAETGMLSAQVEADKAAAVVELFTDIIETLRPEHGVGEVGRELTVREMLDSAASRGATRTAGRADVGVAIQLALARTYYSLELTQQAFRLAKFAHEVAVKLDPDSTLVADAEELLGWLSLGGGELDQAQDHMARALEIRESAEVVDVVKLAKALKGMASIARRRSPVDLDQALVLVERALAVLAASDRDAWEVQVDLLNQKTVLLNSQGRLDLADQIAQMALDVCEEQGTGLIESVTPLQNLGMRAKAKGNPVEAIAKINEAISILESVYPEGHSRTASMLRRLALIHQDQDNHAKAEQVLDQSIEIFRANPGQKSREDLPRCLMALGRSQVELGDYAGGRDSGREAAQLLRQAANPNYWRLGLALQVEGAALVSLGQYAEAITPLKDCYSQMVKADKSESVEALECMNLLAAAYEGLSMAEEAKTWRTRRQVVIDRREASRQAGSQR